MKLVADSLALAGLLVYLRSRPKGVTVGQVRGYAPWPVRKHRSSPWIRAALDQLVADGLAIVVTVPVREGPNGFNSIPMRVYLAVESEAAP